MVFVAGKKAAYFDSARNPQLIDVFFASAELLALAVVDSLELVQNRDPDKNRLVLCSCTICFALGRSELTYVKQCPYMLIGNMFRMDDAGNDACFPEAF